jgi:hypothetical protein
MSNRQQILASAQAALRAACGLSVTYSRDAASVSIQAVKGKTVHGELDEAGALVRDEGVDWLVAASDLVLSGAAITPQAGDVIAVEESSGTGQYEVMPIAGGPCFADSGSPGTTLRIHTRKIALVATE